MRDIIGYEGLYQINETGEIMALQKQWITGKGRGRLHTQPEKRIKSFITRFGYERVALSRNGQYKKFHVHRLVAMVFCDGFFEGAHVNHIDGNKLNNHFLNLEWVTPGDNYRHAFAMGLRVITDDHKKALSKRHSGNKNSNATKVVDTSTGKVFGTIKEAANYFNIKPHNVYAYLKGRNPNPTTLKYA